MVAFKEANGFPGYRVGDDGSVWTCWKTNGQKPSVMSNAWKRMRPGHLKNGYLQVALSRGGKRFQKKVHHLVLEAFVGVRAHGQETRHKNGIPSDNRLDNLCWGTHSENYQDRVRHGTDNRGDRNGPSILTDDDVKDIVALLRTTDQSQEQIAKTFGVTQGTIAHINNGRSWGHLTGASRGPLVSRRRPLGTGVVAKMLGVGSTAVQRWMDTGILQSWRVNSHRRTSLDHVRAFAKQRGIVIQEGALCRV